jgi:hypothetical protein
MIITILSWIYIGGICLIIGMSANKLLSKIIPVPSAKQFGITGFFVTGITVLTVYAEIFSIFYKVGALCHLIMLALAVIGAISIRNDFSSVFSGIKDRLIRNKYLFLIMLFAFAFFTSRGKYHTDTGIYHAQAIRILEEYGLFKGLANVQLHFAYNSAYLPLCALFTLSFVLPYALHTMTGFFALLFSSYAMYGLLDFKEHKRHGGDFARIAILVYALTNMTGFQSPATDYGTMFFVLYILCEWITYAEEKNKLFSVTEDIALYGYLSVLSIFAVSMKLSAAIMVVLAVFPLILLIQKKMWRELFTFLLIGFISFLPYLVRNVIISGWLFYPVESIDLFNVIWKVPVEYMRHDSDQIKVWGRCLFDVSKVEEPVTSWLPAWWESKQHYEEMLIYSQIVGSILLGINAVYRLIKKEINEAIIVFYVTVYLNLIMWFFTAPFIRYGLAFLLVLPLCSLGDIWDFAVKKQSVALYLLAALIIINFCSWVDNYFMGDMVFVKHYIADGYYISPIPFEQSEMTPIDMSKEVEGQIVYSAGLDEVNSYYVCPGTCYEDMVLRSELIGNTIKDGFKAK